jgi:cell shape-determining protein MreC
MVTIVVLINIIISLMLLYLAQQLRKAKDTLAFITNTFNQYERASYAALHTAPDNIYLGKEKIQNLRQDNQMLKQQIQQLRQILSLIVLVKQISQGSFPFPYLKLKNPSKLG